MTLLVIRKVQIKASIIHHHTPTRMVKVLKDDNTKGWEWGKALDLSYISVGNVK